MYLGVRHGKYNTQAIAPPYKNRLFFVIIVILLFLQFISYYYYTKTIKLTVNDVITVRYNQSTDFYVIINFFFFIFFEFLLVIFTNHYSLKLIPTFFCKYMHISTKYVLDIEVKFKRKIYIHKIIFQKIENSKINFVATKQQFK